MRREQCVPLRVKVLSVRKTMRARDLAEAVEHHDLDAARGGAFPDLRNICGPIAALSAPLVIASRLQDQHARILAEHATNTRQHLSGGVTGNACILDTNATSLGLQQPLELRRISLARIDAIRRAPATASEGVAGAEGNHFRRLSGRRRDGAKQQS
jgi:hypothetical protein